jgi:uncharacterized protein (TIGR03118 family)
MAVRYFYVERGCIVMSPLEFTLASRRGAGILIAAVVLLATSAMAQYSETILTGNIQGVGNFTDPNLVNAWGIAALPGGPFWVSDNGTGLSTIYNLQGEPQSLVVTIPAASGSGLGRPTGIVANISSDFKVTEGNSSAPALFLFATEDGTISGWNPTVDGTKAIIAVNSSPSRAIYTGLAIATTPSGNFIYAADSNNNLVDIYDGNFNLVRSFTDTSLPAGFTPYGIQVIRNKLYVTFNKGGSASGFVNTYDLNGGSQVHLVSQGELNAPWGVALAPPNFGPMSNALLVSNLGSGWINAYDPNTGAFLGYLNQGGAPITIDELWGIMFAVAPSATSPGRLYFTAGPAGYSNGLFGVIMPDSAVNGRNVH